MNGWWYLFAVVVVGTSIIIIGIAGIKRNVLCMLSFNYH